MERKNASCKNCSDHNIKYFVTNLITRPEIYTIVECLFLLKLPYAFQSNQIGSTLLKTVLSVVKYNE